MKKHDKLDKLLRDLKPEAAPQDLRKKIISEIEVENMLGLYHLKVKAPNSLKSGIMESIKESTKYRPIISTKSWISVLIVSLIIVLFVWVNPLGLESNPGLFNAFKLELFQGVDFENKSSSSLQLIGLISISIIVLLGMDQLLNRKRL